MSFEIGNPFIIRNMLAGLVLSLEPGGGTSIIGADYDETGTNQAARWIVDEVDGKAVIRSLEDDLFIGFDGDAEEGKELIVGDRDVARIWDIEPVSDASNEVKIKLRDSSYVIMFSVLDLNPGTHAQLELERSEDADNQTWIPIEA